MTSERKTILIIICIGICILSAIGSLLLFQEKQGLDRHQHTEAYTPAESFLSNPTSSPGNISAFTNTPTDNNQSYQINLNTANRNELKTLKGIGPALAERIIKYRQEKPFKTIYDIKKVNGIGDKTFEKIKDKITVSE